MIRRDWKRIEAELDELLPAAPPLADRVAPEGVSQRAKPSPDEEAVLKHIAEALRLD